MAFYYTILCTLVQIFFYTKHNREENDGARYMMLAIILLTNTFFTPRFFVPDLDELYGENHPRCGMPIFAVYSYFFIIGNAVAIITHFICFLLRKK